MPKLDIPDEAIIDSPPMVVYEAILNEASGVTHWWMPCCKFKLRGDIPIDREGAIFDMTIHVTGTPKFSAKVTKTVEAKSIEEEIAGDFVASCKYSIGNTAYSLHTPHTKESK